MQPLNAVVKNGRLTLDVPSDLEEGQVVVLLPLEELLASAEAFEDDKNGGLSFEIIQAPVSQRRWKKSKPVDAAALIEELKAI